MQPGHRAQIVAVFTDGLENASRQWTRAELFDAITARKKDGWTFVLMGANQDSYAEADGLARTEPHGDQAAWPRSTPFGEREYSGPFGLVGHQAFVLAPSVHHGPYKVNQTRPAAVP